jgi:two-component system invasion response regulator UvrY
MRILIVDDHAIMRNGVKQTLSDAFDETIFGEASSAEEALTLIRSQSWDVVVLDVGLPGRSGLDALKEIKSQRPELPVIVFSMYGEEQYARRVLKAGASGYVTKGSPTRVFADAIRTAVAGGKYISAKLGETFVAELSSGGKTSESEKLSDREYQVLSLIGSGKSVKEIALKLSLSVKTISTYRTRLLEKLNLTTTAALISYAIQHNIIE